MDTLYADNATLITGGATVGENEGVALKNLAAVEHWFKQIRLQLKTDTTQRMVYTLDRTQAAARTTFVKLLSFVTDKRAELH